MAIFDDLLTALNNKLHALGAFGIALRKADGTVAALLAGNANGAALVDTATCAAAISIDPKTVPTGAAEAVSVSTSTPGGLTIVADEGNAASVFVGGPTVTTANGIELKAGDSKHFNVSDPAGLYCIASVAGQIIRLVSP
jgi:hypothetical protein